jgi:hypothetical protein
MRILRSRSDQEVTSVGFALFVAGLIMAGFVGGAIKTLLSSEQIQFQIQSQLQTALPAFQIKMEKAKVKLARGIWPGVAIQIPKLHLTKPETCGEFSGTIGIENIDLPLELFSLIRSRVHWDVISAKHVDLKVSRKPCADKIEKPAVANESPKPASPVANGQFEKVAQDRVREELKNGLARAIRLQDHFRGLEIADADISSLDDPSWKIAVSKLRVQISNKIKINANFHFEKTTTTGRMEHDATLQAQAEDGQLKWEIRSPLNEGLMSWIGSADHASDKLDQRVVIRQLPMKDVLAELKAVGWGPKGGSPRFIWLSCEMIQNGPLSRFKSLPLHVTECKLDGEGEQLRAVSNQEVWPWDRTPLHEPLRFQATKLSVQTVLDLIGQKGLPAIVPKPGQWSGDFEFSNPKTWGLAGVLENTEVVFSNQSIRGKQVISRIKMSTKATVDQVKIEFTEFGLVDGSAQGRLSLILDPKFEMGEWDVDLTSFRLAPAIQNLMLGGLSTPLSFTGHGKFVGGELHDWHGQAHWQSSEGRGWGLKDSTVETVYQDGRFNLKARVGEIELSNNFSHSDLVQTIMPDVGEPKTSWKFRDGSGSAIVAKGGGEFKDLRMHGPNGKIVRFQGAWVRGGDLSGVVRLDGTKRTWKLRGSDGKLSLD